MKILNQGFDHVEYIVRDIELQGKTYSKMGFEKIGTRSDSKKGLKTDAWAQGKLRVLLTQSDGSPASDVTEQVKFLKAQDEGICVLAIEVDDARKAYEETLSRGAQSALAPVVFEAPQGRVVRSEIWTPGRVRYAFIERHAPANGPALLDEGLVVSRLQSPSPLGIQHIDHLTNNVDMGEMKKWVEWYGKIFDFGVTRHFKIKTGRTGLISDVVQSADGKIIVPINEATEPESQVQEFVNRMKGPGVQHLALLVDDLIATVSFLEKQGFKFLDVPETYYEEVPTRVPGVTEDLQVVKKHNLLLDGDQTGYLLQIFTSEILGPFFFEFIQRKGNKGFGEGNFRALFESIERDQIRRGVLKA